MSKRISDLFIAFCLFLGLVLLSQGTIPMAPPRAGAMFTYTVHGVPPVPGQLRRKEGHIIGDVNLYTGEIVTGVPLFTINGRGQAAFDLGLYYSGDVEDIVREYNTDMQASWVGTGWGLDAPFIFGKLTEHLDGNGLIDSVNTAHTLYWDGLADPMSDSTGSWESTFRKGDWEATTDANGYIDKFTYWAIDGTKYTFDNRCETNISSWDGQTRIDLERPVPYRWNLTEIVDRTGLNKITFHYDEDRYNSEGYYTRANYLDYIKEEASGREVHFEREDRAGNDIPSQGTTNFFEGERLDYLFMKNTSGDTLKYWDFRYAHIDGPGGDDKLLLDELQQMNPTSTGTGLPAWGFTYQDNETNKGGLDTIQYPEGGTKDYRYHSYSDTWHVDAVIMDNGMGASTARADFTILAAEVNPLRITHIQVVPPNAGSGHFKYWMSDVEDSEGAIVLSRSYDGQDLIHETRFEYDEEAYYRVTETVNVEFSGSDSLVTIERRTVNDRGLPTQIVRTTSPFAELTVSPTYGGRGEYFIVHDIKYATFADYYHRFDLVDKETWSERWVDNGDTTTNKLTAQWTTTTEERPIGGSFYNRIRKVYKWAGAAGSTHLDGDLPSSSVDGLVLGSFLVEVDDFGQPVEVRDGVGNITKLFYGDNTNNYSNSASGLDHRFPTGVIRPHGQRTATDWDEDLGLSIKTATPLDSTETSYDDYGRPIYVVSDGDTLSYIEYFYSRETTGSFNPSSPNYTRTTTYHHYGGSSTSTVSTLFTDGLGNKRQTQVRKDGSTSIIRGWNYVTSTNVMLSEYLPYETQTTGYDNPVGSGADSIRYQYVLGDPRYRLSRLHYSQADSVYYDEFTYGLETYGGHAYYIRSVKDRDGEVHKRWLNQDGSVFMTALNNSYEAIIWSDALGRAEKVLPPRAQEATSSPFNTDLVVNAQGMLTERDEPDQGTTRTAYDQALRPVYVQEAADSGSNKFWATKYDSLGRKLRVGKEQQSLIWNVDPVDADTSYGAGAGEWRKRFYYDDEQLGGSNGLGRLTMAEGNWDTDSTAEFVEKYSYTRQGWVSEQNTYIDGLGTRDIAYEYDSSGRIRKLSFEETSSSEKFFLWYEYDNVGRMTEIYSAFADSKPNYPTAEYTYNARGQVTKVEVRNDTDNTVRQTIDYAYNTRGYLTKINDPSSLGSDQFAMELGYESQVTDPNGGTSPNPPGGWSKQRAANPSQVVWINRKFNDTPVFYNFSYDSREQLTAADSDVSNYDRPDYRYDDNGNIAQYENSSRTSTYYYDGDEANTNRLDHTSGIYDDNWDYDASGRMIKDTLQEIDSVDYWFPGAAAHKFDGTYSNKFGTGNAYVLNLYNTNNLRVRKYYYYEVPNRDDPRPPPPGSTEAPEGRRSGPSVDSADALGYDAYWSEVNYIRDVDGNVLAVFEESDSQSQNLKERYVWGPTGLISIVKGENSATTRYFTITDHLGSIRVVTDDTGSAVSGYDYSPYGYYLRHSETSGAGSRFQFGSKERDTEHNWRHYYFGARFYRPTNYEITARFYKPDPLKRGWSHYSFARNNPIRFTDPTGKAERDELESDPDPALGPSVRRGPQIYEGQHGYYSWRFSRYAGSFTNWAAYMAMNSPHLRFEASVDAHLALAQMAKEEAEWRRKNLLPREPQWLRFGLTIVCAAWTLPQHALGIVWGGAGHIWGLATGQDVSIRFEQGQMQFLKNPLMPTALALGSVGIYGRRHNPDATVSPNKYRIGDEEYQHTRQSYVLGWLYIPLQLLSGSVSIVHQVVFRGETNLINAWHGPWNLLEIGPHETPPRPWWPSP